MNRKQAKTIPSKVPKPTKSPLKVLKKRHISTLRPKPKPLTQSQHTTLLRACAPPKTRLNNLNVQFSTSTAFPPLPPQDATSPPQHTPRPRLPPPTITFAEAILDWDDQGSRYQRAKQIQRQQDDEALVDEFGAPSHQGTDSNIAKNQPSTPKSAISKLYETRIEEELFEQQRNIANEESSANNTTHAKTKRKFNKDFPSYSPYYDPTVAPSPGDLAFELQQISKSYRQITKSPELLHVLGTFVGTFDLLPQLTRRIFQLSKQLTEFNEKYETPGFTPHMKKLIIDTVLPPFSSSAPNNVNNLTKRTSAIALQQHNVKQNKKNKVEKKANKRSTDSNLIEEVQLQPHQPLQAKEIDYQRLIRSAQSTNLFNPKESPFGVFGTDFAVEDLCLGFHRIADGTNALQLHEDSVTPDGDSQTTKTSKTDQNQSEGIDFVALHRAMLPDRIVFNMTLAAVMKTVANAYPHSVLNPLPLPTPSNSDPKSLLRHHAVFPKQKLSHLGNLLQKYDKSTSLESKQKHQKGLQQFFKNTTKLTPSQAQIDPSDHPGVKIAFELIDYMISTAFNPAVVQNFLLQRQQLYFSAVSDNYVVANMDAKKRQVGMVSILKNQQHLIKTGTKDVKTDLKTRFKPFFPNDDVYEDDYYLHTALAKDSETDREEIDAHGNIRCKTSSAVSQIPIDMTPELGEHIEHMCENTTPQLDTFVPILRFAAEQGNLTITSAAFLRIIQLDLLYLNRLDYTIKKHKGDIEGALKLQNDYDEIEQLLFAGLSNNSPILPSHYAQFTTLCNFLSSNSFARRPDIPSPLQVAETRFSLLQKKKQAEKAKMKAANGGDEDELPNDPEDVFDPSSVSPIERNRWLSWIFPDAILQQTHPLAKSVNIEDLLNLPPLDTSRWTGGQLVPGRVPTPVHFVRTALKSCVNSPTFLEEAFGSALPNIQTIHTHSLTKRPHWQLVQFAEDLIATVVPKPVKKVKDPKNATEAANDAAGSGSAQGEGDDNAVHSSIVLHPSTTLSLPNQPLLDQLRIALRFWTTSQLSKTFTRTHNLQGHFTNALIQFLNFNYNQRPELTQQSLKTQYGTTVKTFSQHQLEDEASASGTISPDIFQSLFTLSQQLPAHTNTLAHRHLLLPVVIKNIHDKNPPPASPFDETQQRTLAHANATLEMLQKTLLDYGIISLESQQPNKPQQAMMKQKLNLPNHPSVLTDQGFQFNLDQIFPPTSLDNVLSTDRTINELLAYVPTVQIPEEIHNKLFNPAVFPNVFVDLGAGDGEHSIHHALKSTSSTQHKPDLVIACDILPQRLSKMLSTHTQRRNPVPSVFSRNSDTSAVDLFTVEDDSAVANVNATTSSDQTKSFKVSPGITEPVLALAKRLFVDLQAAHKTATPNIPFAMSMNECVADILKLLQLHTQSNLPFSAHHHLDHNQAVLSYKYPPPIMSKINQIGEKYNASSLDLVKMTTPRNLFSKSQLPPRVLLPTPYDAPYNQDEHQGQQNLFAYCGKASALLSTLPVAGVHTVNLTHPPPPTTDSYFAHHAQGQKNAGLDPDSTLLSEHLLLLAARALRPNGSVFIISDDQRVATFLDRVLTPGFLNQPNSNVQLELCDFFKIEELRIGANGKIDEDGGQPQSRYQKMHQEGKIPNQKGNPDGNSRAWRLVRRDKAWE